MSADSTYQPATTDQQVGSSHILFTRSNSNFQNIIFPEPKDNSPSKLLQPSMIMANKPQKLRIIKTSSTATIQQSLQPAMNQPQIKIFEQRRQSGESVNINQQQSLLDSISQLARKTVYSSVRGNGGGGWGFSQSLQNSHDQNFQNKDLIGVGNEQRKNEKDKKLSGASQIFYNHMQDVLTQRKNSTAIGGGPNRQQIRRIIRQQKVPASAFEELEKQFLKVTATTQQSPSPLKAVEKLKRENEQKPPSPKVQNVFGELDSIFSPDLPQSLQTTTINEAIEQKILKKEIQEHVVKRQRAWLQQSLSVGKNRNADLKGALKIHTQQIKKKANGSEVLFYPQDLTSRLQEQKILEKKLRSLQVKSRSVGQGDSRQILMSNLKSEMHANNSITGIKMMNYEHNPQISIVDINDQNRIVHNDKGISKELEITRTKTSALQERVKQPQTESPAMDSVPIETQFKLNINQSNGTTHVVPITMTNFIDLIKQRQRDIVQNVKQKKTIMKFGGNPLNKNLFPHQRSHSVNLNPQQLRIQSIYQQQDRNQDLIVDQRMLMRSSLEKRHDAFINRINYASGFNEYPVDPTQIVTRNDLVNAFDHWRHIQNAKKQHDIQSLAVLPPSQARQRAAEQEEESSPVCIKSLQAYINLQEQEKLLHSRNTLSKNKTFADQSPRKYKPGTSGILKSSLSQSKIMEPNQAQLLGRRAITRQLSQRKTDTPLKMGGISQGRAWFETYVNQDQATGGGIYQPQQLFDNLGGFFIPDQCNPDLPKIDITKASLTSQQSKRIQQVVIMNQPRVPQRTNVGPTQPKTTNIVYNQQYQIEELDSNCQPSREEDRELLTSFPEGDTYQMLNPVMGHYQAGNLQQLQPSVSQKVVYYKTRAEKNGRYITKIQSHVTNNNVGKNMFNANPSC